MIVTRDNERLYLNNSEYNIARTMTALAKIIIENGGKVKPQHTALISNRNLPNSEPIPVTHTSYILFVLDNTYYYFEVGDNLLFPIRYIKTKIIDNKYSKDACLDDCDFSWAYDDFFSSECTQNRIDEVAKMTYDALVNSKCIPIRRNKKKIRVPNIYNDDYHTETILELERFEKIDW